MDFILKFWFYLGGWGAQRDDSEDVQRLRCGLFLDGCEAVASEVKYSKLWNNAQHICNAKENCFDMINILQAWYSTCARAVCCTLIYTTDPRHGIHSAWAGGVFSTLMDLQRRKA